MSYNAALDTVYNHYLTTYSSMRPSQYDAHKKSELRSVYNSIVKLNKDSPLFLMNNTKETQEFAIGIKENAQQLRNTIASLGGLDEAETLNKKIAYSTDKNVVTASFVGSYNEEEEIPPFDISVSSLATQQINQGSFLPAVGRTALPSDSYSFDINIADLNYEFQFNINDGETNSDIQNRLARLFNNADIGLTADVISDDKGNSALRLTSNATGLPAEKEQLFSVSDDKTSKTAGAVSYFGLNTVAQNASNAEFILNGDERVALSNHFTVSKMYELNLHGVSKDDSEPVHIGLKTDMESLNENINSLINGYNSFVSTSSAYTDAYPKSNRILSDMKGIANLYKEQMSSLGLQVREDGQIHLEDSDKLNEAVSGESSDRLAAVKDFTNAVLRKTNQVSLNPMEYVDKKIIAYKNPGHNFANPYITSAYSGMMFNSYC